MAEEIDYAKLLEEAEAAVAEAQAVAAFARRKLGLAADAETPLAATVRQNQLTESTIPKDAFFKMGVAEAIEKYLGIAKQPKSVNTIADALRDGGLPTKSQSLYSTVYTALKRGQGSTFSLVKKDWGLAEWYR